MIRCQTLGLDLPTQGGAISGDADGEATAIPQRKQRLNEALAEASAAHQGGTTSILEGPSQDFTGTGTAAIDHGDEGSAVHDTGRSRLLFIDAPPVLGFDDSFAVKQTVGHCHSGADQSA